MDKNEQLKLFYRVLEREFKNIKKKYKQMCFLQHIDFDDDVLQDTIVKVADKILKDGIKAENEREMECYLFRAFKLNSLQNKLQKQKRLLDDNVVLEELDVYADEEYDESKMRFDTFARNYIEKEIKEHFDLISYSIFRLRYLVTINGKNLTFKDIKGVTKISDSRKRLVEINNYIRNNLSMDFLKREYLMWLENMENK